MVGTEQVLTPLHIACLADASIEILQKQIDCDSEALFRRDPFEYRTPLECLCWIHEATIQKGIKMCRAKTDALESDLIHFWEKATALVMATYHRRRIGQEVAAGSRTKRLGGIVHACACLPSCPLEFFQLALVMHREQLLEGDEEQMLPLHLAIESGHQSHILQALLRECPASVTAVDKSGFAPFMTEATRKQASLTVLFTLLTLCPEIERFSGAKIDTTMIQSRLQG